MKFEKDKPPKDEFDDDEQAQQSLKPTFDTIHLDDFRKLQSSSENITYKKDHIEIKTIDGKSTIKINSPYARVQSQIHKRLELEHIVDTVAKINIVPDFGFQNDVMNKEDLRGWNLFRDFV